MLSSLGVAFQLTATMRLVQAISALKELRLNYKNSLFLFSLGQYSQEEFPENLLVKGATALVSTDVSLLRAFA